MSTTENASKVTLKSCEKSNHKNTSKKPPFSGRETTVSGKDPPVILQINIEGWTLAKREVLVTWPVLLAVVSNTMLAILEVQ